MENRLTNPEISIIKGIFEYCSKMSNQEILAKFSIPSRTVNSGRIAEIKQGHKRYKNITPATKDQVDDFLNGKTTLNDFISEKVLFDEKGSLTNRIEKVLENIDVDISKGVVCKHETHDIEYKEFYEKESVPTYAKTLVSMVNANVCGSIIFGVSDTQEIIGIKKKYLVRDVGNKLQEFLYDSFDPYIKVEAAQDIVLKKRIIQVKILNIPNLPVICKKDKTYRDSNGEHKHLVKDGEIYYRYGECVKRIKFTELMPIIKQYSKR